MSGQAFSPAAHDQPVSSQPPGQSAQCTAGSLQSHAAPRRPRLRLARASGLPSSAGATSAPELGIMSPLAELSSHEVSTLAQVRSVTMFRTIPRLNIAGSIPDIICRLYKRCTAKISQPPHVASDLSLKSPSRVLANGDVATAAGAGPTGMGPC